MINTIICVLVLSILVIGVLEFFLIAGSDVRRRGGSEYADEEQARNIREG